MPIINNKKNYNGTSKVMKKIRTGMDNQKTAITKTRDSVEELILNAKIKIAKIRTKIAEYEADLAILKTI